MNYYTNVLPVAIIMCDFVFSLTDERDLAKHRQARNRWLVAYTLLKNPSLQELTASRLNENEL